MRTIFLFFLLYSFCLTAQKEDETISSFEIYYGYHLQNQNFYNQLNLLDDFAFRKPLQMIGIGSSGQFIVTSDQGFNGHIIFNQVIPQTIQVQDSIAGKITGFEFSFAYGRAITTKSAKFALYYYAGFNAGRLRLYGNDLLKQKNAFFSPKIGIQPKIKIGTISVTLILDYDYDLTNPNWRQTKFSINNKTNLIALRQTGFTGQLGVGYVLD